MAATTYTTQTRADSDYAADTYRRMRTVLAEQRARAQRGDDAGACEMADQLAGLLAGLTDAQKDHLILIAVATGGP